MVPLAFTRSRNCPSVFNGAFVKTEVILCYIFFIFVGECTWDTLISGLDLEQP